MISGLERLSEGPRLWRRSSLPTAILLYDVAGEVIAADPLPRPLTKRVWC